MSINTPNFKTETLNLSKLQVYQPLDRINYSNRVHPSYPRDFSTVTEHLFCPRIWSKPNMSLGYNQSLKLKVTRIYDSLCKSTGVRTYFYKLVGSELCCMYQKRPIPQKDFIVIYPNITHMFNDAIGSDKMNINVFKDQEFDLGQGVSRYSLQERILEHAKKTKRALSISETTQGTFDGSDTKYNIFIRNHPKLDANGKPLKCKKKTIVLKGEDPKTGSKLAFYSGDCYSPVEVKHHACIKLKSQDEALSLVFDIFILYSVDQDLYTVYKPNGLKSFDFSHNGRFDGLYIEKESAMTTISQIIEQEQKALNSQASIKRLNNERDLKVA